MAKAKALDAKTLRWASGMLRRRARPASQLPGDVAVRWCAKFLLIEAGDIKRNSKPKGSR